MLYRIFAPSSSKPKIDFAMLKMVGIYAVGCVVAAVVAMSPIGDNDPIGLSMGIFHVLAGATSYYAWQLVPFRHSKKDDAYMPLHSSYT